MKGDNEMSENENVTDDSITSEIDAMLGELGPSPAGGDDDTGSSETSETSTKPEGGEETTEALETTTDKAVTTDDAGESKEKEAKAVETEVETTTETATVVESEDGEGDGGEEPSELELLQRQNALLLGRVEELAAFTPVPVVQPEVVKPVASTETTEQIVTTFLGDYDIDDVVSKPALFNEVMTKLVDHTRRVTTEGILKAIPQIVITHVRQQQVLGKAVEEFYQTNPDLVVVKKTVGAVANQLIAENPSMAVEEVFKQAAVRTRSVLGMKATATGVVKPAVTVRERKPALMKKVRSSTRPVKEQLDDLQKDINVTLGI